MSVFDLHVHTVKGSSDSSLTPEQLLEESINMGLDGVCITEHSGGWEDQEILEMFSDSRITVVRGLEVETEMGHILVFGLHAYVTGINKITDLRKEVDLVGGVMISAHPFRNFFNRPPYNQNLIFRDTKKIPKNAIEASTHPLFNVVDDIETANASNIKLENEFASAVAYELGFSGTGGSDAHSSQGIGKCVTVFEGDVRSEKELIEALHTKAFRSKDARCIDRTTSSKM